MWRAHALFGQAQHPNHHAAMHTDTHDGPHIHLIGDHIKHNLWGEATVLCHACHAELQPHEFHDGCCADRDSCAWRALSERCCW